MTLLARVLDPFGKGPWPFWQGPLTLGKGAVNPFGKGAVNPFGKGAVNPFGKSAVNPFDKVVLLARTFLLTRLFLLARASFWQGKLNIFEHPCQKEALAKKNNLVNILLSRMLLLTELQRKLFSSLSKMPQLIHSCSFDTRETCDFAAANHYKNQKRNQ